MKKVSKESGSRMVHNQFCSAWFVILGVFHLVKYFAVKKLEVEKFDKRYGFQSNEK